MKRLLEETCDSSTLGWAESANLCSARQHAGRDCPITETKSAYFPLRETSCSTLRPKNFDVEHLPEQIEVS
jgi:hypothetical protein